MNMFIFIGGFLGGLISDIEARENIKAQEVSYDNFYEEN